jgi:hypothetical protein
VTATEVLSGNGSVGRAAVTSSIGEVRSMRVRPWAEGVSTLEATLVDETGGITLVFLGRHHIAGMALGCHLEAEGMVGENRERLVILNPIYRLLSD